MVGGCEQQHAIVATRHPETKSCSSSSPSPRLKSPNHQRNRCRPLRAVTRVCSNTKKESTTEAKKNKSAKVESFRFLQALKASETSRELSVHSNLIHPICTRMKWRSAPQTRRQLEPSVVSTPPAVRFTVRRDRGTAKAPLQPLRLAFPCRACGHAVEHTACPDELSQPLKRIVACPSCARVHSVVLRGMTQASEKPLPDEDTRAPAASHAPAQASSRAAVSPHTQDVLAGPASRRREPGCLLDASGDGVVARLAPGAMELNAFDADGVCRLAGGRGD